MPIVGLTSDQVVIGLLEYSLPISWSTRVKNYKTVCSLAIKFLKSRSEQS